MKKLTLALLACGALVQAGAAEVHWTTDYPKALATAKTEQKMVLLNFTGSDWCPFCIRFDHEVLSTETFAKYAQANLVPVVIDFPHTLTQSAALKKANDQLQAQYKVQGYPTYVLLNCDGKEVWRQEGYAGGGPTAFIARLRQYASK